MKRMFAVLFAAFLLAAGFLLASAGCAEGWPPMEKTEGKVSLSSEKLSGVYLCNYEGYEEFHGAGNWFHFGGLKPLADDSGSGEEEPVTAAQMIWISGEESLRDIWEFDLEKARLYSNLDDVQAGGKEAVLRADFESEHYYASVEFTIQVADIHDISIRLDSETFDAVAGQPWGVSSEVLSSGVHISPEMYFYGSIRNEDGDLTVENDTFFLDGGSRVTLYKPGEYSFFLYLNLARNCVMIRRPITLNVRERSEADESWNASWPPSDKTEGYKTDTNSHSTAEGPFFINGEGGSLGTAPRYLAAGDQPEEVVQSYHITFLSGDEWLSGLISPSTYGGSRDEANLQLVWGNITKPGTAEFRIDMTSDHFWASETIHAEVLDANSFPVKVVSADVNIPVGQEVRLGELYEMRQFVATEPEFEYSCYVAAPDGSSDEETEDYKLEHWQYFTAKKAGDYPMTLYISIGKGLRKTFPITVHASEETETAAVDGEAPLTAKALRLAEEEKQRALRSFDAEKEPDDLVVMTDDAVFLYKNTGSTAAIRKIRPLTETLTVPAELDGKRVVGVEEQAVSGVRSDVKTVIIEEGIQTIGDYAFSYLDTLQNLRLPESLTSIGEYAFHSSHLKDIVLPSGLKKEGIGRKAFNGIGTDQLTLTDGTDLMALSLQELRTEGKYAAGILMSVFSDGYEYLVREDGGAVVIGWSYEAWQDGYTKLTIPENLNGHPVREIGKEAFLGIPDLQTVVLPEGLEVIAEQAFAMCENLSQVQIPSTVREIGSKAFSGIAAEELSLPEGAVNAAMDWYAKKPQQDATGLWTYQLQHDGTAAITGYTFTSNLVFPSEVDGYSVTSVQRVPWYSGIEEDWAKVKSVTLPKTLKTIGEEAFINMRNLTAITLPEGLETIGRLAFDNTGLREIRIPEGITLIEEGAFKSCNQLGKVTLPSTLLEIGNEAFSSCPITAVKFPEGLQRIGDRAFCYHKINDLVIPAGVQRIGNGAFHSGGKKVPAKVTFQGFFTELGKGVLGYDDGSSDYYNAHYEEILANGGNYIYDSSNPENWKDYYADSSNDTTHTITLSCYPGSTADILYQYNVKKNWLKWGDENKRTAPADRVLRAGLYQMEDAVFELTIPEGVEEIEEKAFQGLRTLCKINLPSTLTIIGDRAFENCSALAEVTLPKNMSSIGKECFRGCVSLTKINLPENITEIPDGLFAECKKLMKLTLPNTGLIRIGENAFNGCAALTSVKLNKGLEEIGAYAFTGTGMKSAVIPDSVTRIGNGAFSGSSITSLTLSKSLTEIPELLCFQCMELKTVKIPAGVQTIGNSAFKFCHELTGLTLPDGLISIGDGAFQQLTDGVQYYYVTTNGAKSYSGLKNLKIPASLQTIGAGAFACCDALTSVTFARDSQLTEIGEDAFAMCLRLKEITLPDSVRNAGDYVFANCLSLKKADLGGGITKTGKSLFLYCDALTNLTVPDTLTEIGESMLEGHGEKLTVTCGEGSAMEDYLRKAYPEVKMAYPKKK